MYPSLFRRVLQRRFWFLSTFLHCSDVCAGFAALRGFYSVYKLLLITPGHVYRGAELRSVEALEFLMPAFLPFLPTMLVPVFVLVIEFPISSLAVTSLL